MSHFSRSVAQVAASSSVRTAELVSGGRAVAELARHREQRAVTAVRQASG